MSRLDFSSTPLVCRSHLRLSICISHAQLFVASLIWTLILSCASLSSNSHLHSLCSLLIGSAHSNPSFESFACASHMHLSFTHLIWTFRSRPSVAPPSCNPHLHHSCSPLVCTSLTYTCRWRLSVVPLTGTSHVHLSLAPFICTSHLFISVARFILLVISRFVLDDFG